MAEMWLNYGEHEIVLDIDQENLAEDIFSDDAALSDGQIIDKLHSLDTSKPIELVLLHCTDAIIKTVNALFAECESRSHPIPRISTDKRVVNMVSSALPEGSSVLPFESTSLGSSDIVFVAEAETDGLFGYGTIATTLLRKFGGEKMTTAYEKRAGNRPVPGHKTSSSKEAAEFVDEFEIRGIEILATSKGAADIAVGHPSKTMKIAEALAKSSRTVEPHKAILASTGKVASNFTLSDALHSLWSCCNAARKDGEIVLLAECLHGLGAHALSMCVEGRLNPSTPHKPEEYIDGLENILFLNEIGKRVRIGIVSVLPELYTERLGMASFASGRKAASYMLKRPRQKVLIVRDGSRVVLNPPSAS